MTQEFTLHAQGQYSYFCMNKFDLPNILTQLLDCGVTKYKGNSIFPQLLYNKK